MMCSGSLSPAAFTHAIMMIVSRFPFVRLWRYLMPLFATTFVGFTSNCTPVSFIFQIRLGSFILFSVRTCFRAWKYFPTFSFSMHWCRMAAVPSGCRSDKTPWCRRLNRDHHIKDGLPFLNDTECSFQAGQHIPRTVICRIPIQVSRGCWHNQWASFRARNQVSVWGRVLLPSPQSHLSAPKALFWEHQPFWLLLAQNYEYSLCNNEMLAPSTLHSIW